jgi:hypothetical protein
MKPVSMLAAAAAYGGLLFTVAIFCLIFHEPIARAIDASGLENLIVLGLICVSPVAVEFGCRGLARRILRHVVLICWTCGWAYNFWSYGLGFPTGWLIWLGIYVAGVAGILLLVLVRWMLGVAPDSATASRGFDVVPRRNNQLL